MAQRCSKMRPCLCILLLLHPCGSLPTPVSIPWQSCNICIHSAGNPIICIPVQLSSLVSQLVSKWISVINCTNSHLSTDVSFATAIDMFCSVGHICYLIWFDVSFFYPHNWMAFVRLNKRHVMLCYVIYGKLPTYSLNARDHFNCSPVEYFHFLANIHLTGANCLTDFYKCRGWYAPNYPPQVF